MQTVAFPTLGCKVNQYETQAIREQFVRAGVKEVGSKEKADIYVINTCTVTSKADQKSRQIIRFSRRKNPRARIVVTGCYSEKNAQDIKNIKGVDFIVSNSRKHKIVEIIKADSCSESQPAEFDYHSYPFLAITDFKNHTRAFIKIQDGCNQNCSYCKVRVVRGRSRSRSLEDVVNQARTLADSGFKEIVLIGVHLGAYGFDLAEKIDLANLAEKLEGIDGIERIRLSSLEPLDVTGRIIGKMTDSNKLCPHIHISLQSGDDYILSRMNRNYTGAEIKKLVNNLKSKIKDIALTLDVMVGFPGEGRENFSNTFKLLEEIEPSRVHIFPYSRRQNTPAYAFSNLVLPQEVKKRYRCLEELAMKTSLAYRKRFLNSTVKVLVETEKDRTTGLLCGYSDTYIKLVFKGSDSLKNKIVPVKIEDVTIGNTIGKLA